MHSLSQIIDPWAKRRSRFRLRCFGWFDLQIEGNRGRFWLWRRVYISRVPNDRTQRRNLDRFVEYLMQSTNRLPIVRLRGRFLKLNGQSFGLAHVAAKSMKRNQPDARLQPFCNGFALFQRFVPCEN